MMASCDGCTAWYPQHAAYSRCHSNNYASTCRFALYYGVIACQNSVLIQCGRIPYILFELSLFYFAGVSSSISDVVPTLLCPIYWWICHELHATNTLLNSVLPKILMAPVRIPILRRFGQVRHIIPTDFFTRPKCDLIRLWWTDG